MIASFDWVAEHADEIEVAGLWGGCAAENIPPGLEYAGHSLDDSKCDDEVLNEAIEELVDKGVVVVLPAGNGNLDDAYIVPQRHPAVLTVSVVADDDGKPGGEGSGCGSEHPDDERVSISHYGLPVSIAAPLCGATSGAAGKVVGAAAALASQCNPEDRAGVEFIVDTLMAEGETGEIAEGGWLDDSGDPYKEPLLNLHDEEVFDPVLMHTSKPRTERGTFARRLRVALPPGGVRRRLRRPRRPGRDRRGGRAGRGLRRRGLGLWGCQPGDLAAGPARSRPPRRQGAYAIDTADVDGDRRADLLTVGSAEGDAYVHAGNADGSFDEGVKALDTSAPVMAGNGGNHEPIALADVTGEGRADYVFYARKLDLLYTAPGLPGGTFGTPVPAAAKLDSALLDREGHYFLDVIDVTGEELDANEPIDYNARHSYADLVTMNSDGKVYVFAGQGDGKFAAPVTTAQLDPIMDDGEGAEPVGLGDVDRDRRADLLVLDGQTLELYRGQANGTFAAPSSAYEGTVDSSLLDGKRAGADRPARLRS